MMSVNELKSNPDSEGVTEETKEVVVKLDFGDPQQ